MRSRAAAGPPVGELSTVHEATNHQPQPEVEPRAEESAALEEAARRKALAIKRLVQTAVIATFTMTLQSRFIAVAQATILKQLLGGDAIKTASLAALMTSMSSLASFAVNPLFGQLSDVYGRRFFMLLSPVMILIARIGVLVHPAVGTIWLSRFLISIFNATFNSAVSAALADIMADSPSELAKVFSRVQYMSRGFATIVGPTISGLLVTRNWRFSYMASTSLCILNLLVCVPKLVKRVPPPKPGLVLRWSACNPFSFLSLFNPRSDYNAGPRSRRGDMAKLALVCGLQQGTTSGMTDPQFPLIAGRLGWGSSEMGMYQSAQGIANVLAGWLTGPVLSVCGRSGITYLGNALQTLSFIGTGMARSGPTLIGALALRAPVNENSAVQAMLAAAAKRNDIGQGRLAADVANFAAVTKVFTPILYSYTAQNGSTSQPFYVAAFLFFVCNVVFAMVASNEALPLTRSWARLRDAVPGPGFRRRMSSLSLSGQMDMGEQ